MIYEKERGSLSKRNKDIVLQANHPMGWKILKLENVVQKRS